TAGLEKAAPLYRMEHEWRWKQEDMQAVYSSPSRTLAFTPGLTGGYQYDNAATAIACLDQLPGFNITDAHIAEGLSKAEWPARLQKLDGHYARLLPAGMELWLDGGHNAQGGEVLAGWLKECAAETYLICGMVKDKDSKSYLQS